MKIYTKTGDKGNTSLFDGKRVKKYNLRIDSYGTVDELNSYLGLLRDLVKEDQLKSEIIGIQNKLFTMGAMLASPKSAEEKGERDRLKIERINSTDIEFLEMRMDQMNEVLPAMTHFILPGGHQAVSFCHIARCVCRRAERITVELHDTEGVEQNILIYLNRLSDYLFVLARKLTFEYKVEEIPWKSE